DGWRHRLVRCGLWRLPVAGRTAHAGDPGGDPAAAHHPDRLRHRAAADRIDQRLFRAHGRGDVRRLRDGRRQSAGAVGRRAFHAGGAHPAPGSRVRAGDPRTRLTFEETMRISIITGAVALALSGAAAASSSPELIAKGEYLARAGDCVVCHTGPGEKPFSGGLKMETQLGELSTSNNPPDKDTGIGNYTFEDSEGAMRRGVAKDGHQPY